MTCVDACRRIPANAGYHAGGIRGRASVSTNNESIDATCLQRSRHNADSGIACCINNTTSKSHSTHEEAKAECARKAIFTHGRDDAVSQFIASSYLFRDHDDHDVLPQTCAEQ